MSIYRYATIAHLANIDPTDIPVDKEVPLIDSINVWDSLLVPNNTVSPREELFLSHYPATGDLTGSNDSALILGTHKIICGYQANQGFWQSPMYV